jgi:hypothetical protein
MTLSETSEVPKLSQRTPANSRAYPISHASKINPLVKDFLRSINIKKGE